MGNAILGHADTQKVVSKEGNAYYRAAVAAMVGYRDAMEDAHCMHCKDQYGLFGVFDGHGGAHCSQFVAARLPLELAKLPAPVTDDDLIRVALKLDDDYRRTGGTAGSTACFCVVTAQENGEFVVQIANVGDSRLIVGRNGGAECVPMTQDHKPSLKAERQRVERLGGFVEADRVDGILAVSRAFGDFEYKTGPGGPLNQKVIAKPDVTRITCTSADWIMIACDGVFEGHFNNEGVVRHIKSLMKAHAEDISHIACSVCDEALKRGSTDNVTCMVIQFMDGVDFRREGSAVVQGKDASVARTLRPLSRAVSSVDSFREKLSRKTGLRGSTSPTREPSANTPNARTSSTPTSNPTDFTIRAPSAPQT